MSPDEWPPPLPGSGHGGAWLPPAEGSEWRVAGRAADGRYAGFAPPRPGGAPPETPPAPPAHGPTLPVNGKAIASVVLAVCGFVVLPMLASVAAIVLGSLGRGEIARDRTTRGARLANLGMILGAAGIVIWIVLIATVRGTS